MVSNISRIGSRSVFWAVSLAIAGVSPSMLLAAESDADAESNEIGEVVVSGSRIVRTGFETPTPVTMITAEDIALAAPTNIANFVNTLPQMGGSSTTRTGNGGTSLGTNGLNLLNLRGLGINRTLVLLDGRRVVASTIAGAVDVNNLPSALVSRVDLVTGGASAAYGSDAVAGVVNFILDKDFQGFKGDLSLGQTSREDDTTRNASLAFGSAFAGGRGHVLLSGEYGYQEGIEGLDPDKRKWFQSCNMLVFAATVRPQRIVRCGVNARTVARGGVITNTAFANTQFGLNGVPQPFLQGTPADALHMVGGNQYYEGDGIDLDSRVDRKALWGQVSFDFTDNLTGRFEASLGTSDTSNTAALQRYPGTGSTALVMRADNPFLDAGIRAAMATANITTFNYGYSSIDLGKPKNNATRETTRFVGALEGRFGEGWRWDAYIQKGRTTTDVALTNTTINANFTRAIDATRNTAGVIVCRVNADTNTTNDDPNCVPLNIFGYGVANPAAIAYVKGAATQYLELEQDVYAATISGEPFNTWAGPVSIAAGAERREESIKGTADALSLVNGYFTGNYKPTVGSYTVNEVFGETVVPLAKGRPGIESLEFNGAIRSTDYSLAGRVTTWKGGLTYKPVDWVTFRAVRSRDIRAANIGELYQSGGSQRVDVNDSTLTSNPRVSIRRVTSGNLNLQPEKADTTSFGIVLQPEALPNFNFSADYYSIKIDGAVTTPAAQEVVDRCARGETSLCALITRDTTGTMTEILGIPVNVAQQTVRGLDLESTWRHDLGAAGSLHLRALFSKLLDHYIVNNNVLTDSKGQNTGSTPDWRWLASVGWNRGPLSAQLTGRGFSSGVYDNRWTSGVEIEDNHIGSATYFDLAGDWQIGSQTEGRKLSAYFKIENLLDRDPAIIGANGLSTQQNNPLLYDTIGRNYRAGVRFQF